MRNPIGGADNAAFGLQPQG